MNINDQRLKEFRKRPDFLPRVLEAVLEYARQTSIKVGGVGHALTLSSDAVPGGLDNPIQPSLLEGLGRILSDIEGDIISFIDDAEGLVKGEDRDIEFSFLQLTGFFNTEA